MKNNRGLTLIEVIVVIAILAIASVAGVSFMALQSNTRVSECANKITTAISKVRVDAMSKAKTPDEYYMEIGKDADGNCYILRYTPQGTVKDIVGNKNVTIKYYSSTGTDVYDVTANTLVLKFDRATGGFEKTAPDSNHVTKILISNGNREIELDLSPITGRVEKVEN